MAGLERFELNYAGVGELLNSGEVQAVLAEYANSVCPPECSVTVQSGSKRASARITTDTEEAYKDCMKHNTLLCAIGGG